MSSSPRAAHPTDTLSDLYDNVTMPADLRRAHQALDQYVDSLYRPEPFTGPIERVAFLLTANKALTAAADQR